MAKRKTTTAERPLPSNSLAHTRECAAQHFGPWLVESKWFSDAVEAVKAGVVKADMPDGPAIPEQPEEPELPFDVVNGTAIICLSGALMKARSKFGGTSTVDARRLIRMAANNDSVQSILLHIDSPGGTVAGTADLAADVRDASAKKPTVAYIEDMGASAAYWIACQCRKIVANSTALIGSIGTVAVLYDSSGAATKEGIKVHVVSTGEFKGAGAPGAPITDNQLADTQEKVNQINQYFLAAVSDGRGSKLTKPIAEIADGRVFVGKQAQDLGLIDEIGSLDSTLEALSRETYRMNATQFAAFAAENPEAAEVKSILSQGHKAGKAEGRTEALGELDAMLAAFPVDANFAVKQFKAGRSVDEAKAIKADIEAEVSAKVEAEKAKLVASAGQSPVATVGATAVTEKAAEKPTDPKAAAEWEWDNEKPQGFSSKERYVAIRSRELAGQFRMVAPSKSK